MLPTKELLGQRVALYQEKVRLTETSGLAFSITVSGIPYFDFYYGGDIDSHTSFPLASVTKTFIAAEVINQVQAGELGLNGKVGRFLPELTTLAEMTVFELLNHTSGIPEYLFIPTEQELNTWSHDEYCKFIATLPIDLEKKFKYSNSNYVLLAKILEKATQKSYLSLLEKTFAQESMLNTFFFNEKEVRTSFKSSRACMGYGDADLFSSVSDIEKWVDSDHFKTYLDFSLTKQNKDSICQSGSTAGAATLFIYKPETKTLVTLLTTHEAVGFVSEVMEWFGVQG